MKQIGKFTIIESDYNECEGKYKLPRLTMQGAIFMFALWLRENDLWYEDLNGDVFTDVWNNTSEIRDNCRIDIHDNYRLCDGYEISYIWIRDNGIVYAAILDTETGNYVGDIEVY